MSELLGPPVVSREDLVVKSLGPCRVDSPILPLLEQRKRSYFNVDESDRVLFDDTHSALVERGVSFDQVPGFEPAGPRRKIFFDPSKTRAGIVTCGGLCPGFNDVIRALVMELHFLYGVRRIHGFCNGYQGFIPKYRRPVLDLTPQVVSQINEHGGTILGTSRGEQDPAEIVDCLERMGINILFVIGGDGTLRGALTICREIESRGGRDRRGRHPQDDRQRHHVHRPELRLPDGVLGRRRRDPDGAHSRRRRRRTASAW